MVRLDPLEVRRNDSIIERGQAMNAWPLEIAVEDKARLPEPCSNQVIFVFFSASTEPGRKVLAALGSNRPLLDNRLQSIWGQVPMSSGAG